MKLDDEGNFNPWVQPKYGTDANDDAIVPPEGYLLLNKNDPLKKGDIPFDVYSGWLKRGKTPRNPSRCKYPDLRYYYYAISDGRWTAWARPV